MKKVILISAKARHGKDTVAEAMKRELEMHDKKVLILHFAQYIKGYLKDHYGWDGIDKSDYWRTKLQQLGTEKIRQEMNMPHFHVNRICEDIKIMEDDFDYFLIPDCRFYNEVDYTKTYFPKQVLDIRVTRYKGEYTGELFESDLTDEQKQHPSETDLDDYKFTLNIPNKTLEQLDKVVDLLVEDLVYSETHENFTIEVADVR